MFRSVRLGQDASRRVDTRGRPRCGTLRQAHNIWNLKYPEETSEVIWGALGMYDEPNALSMSTGVRSWSPGDGLGCWRAAGRSGRALRGGPPAHASRIPASREPICWQIQAAWMPGDFCSICVPGGPNPKWSEPFDLFLAGNGKWSAMVRMLGGRHPRGAPGSAGKTCFDDEKTCRCVYEK